MKKAIIVGNGEMTKHLLGKLASHRIRVCSIIGRSNSGPSLEEALDQENPHAVFLAISTRDKGEAARDYMLTAAKAGVPIITCEKGALSYHAAALRPYLDMIGSSAAVGGGTRMLKYVAARNVGEKPVEIHAVVNGTLNFILDEVRRGRISLSDACKEAVRLGYAEPGNTSDPASIIAGELADVRMKTCVFFNTILARDKLITPDDFGLLELTKHELTKLEREGGDYRLIVTFYRNTEVQECPRLGKQFARYHLDGWHIVGSFRLITETSGLASWLPRGVGNAVHIIEGEDGSGGAYTLSGPGAGYEPTTSAMLADFAEFC